MSFEDEASFGGADTPTLPFSDPKLIRPEPTPGCMKCAGRGLVMNEEGTGKRCTCTLLSFGMKYLTPAYQAQVWDKTFDPNLIAKKNLFIISKRDEWKSVVKAYLMKTLMNLSHATAAPRHIMQAYLSKTESPADWLIINKADLLIINTGFDVRNSQYGNVLSAVITDRTNLGRYTWVVSARKLEDKVFQENYSFEFAQFLKRGTVEVNLDG